MWEIMKAEMETNNYEYMTTRSIILKSLMLKDITWQTVEDFH